MEDSVQVITRARRFRRGPLATMAGLVAVVALGAALRQGGRERNGEPVIQHRPSADLPRLSHLAEPAFAVADAGLVLDFDATPDQLALLDAANARVLVLRRDAGGWEPRLTFGRSGDGPGELRSPNSVAVTHDGGVVVTDETQLHFFSAAGEHVRSTKPRTTCALQRPGVAVGSDGLFLHGTCIRRETAMDTVVAALYWSADGKQFAELAVDVRYTRDGRLGSVLGSTSPLTEGDGRHLFGVGSRNCIHEIRDGAPGPRVEQVCQLTAARYRAAPPAALRERLRRESIRRPEFRHLLRWPDALPVYVDAIAAGEHAVLVRPFSADSVVFELAKSGRELLVAPLNGFVSCRRAGCLWAEHRLDGVRLTLLRVERVAAAAATAVAR